MDNNNLQMLTGGGGLSLRRRMMMGNTMLDHVIATYDIPDTTGAVRIIGINGTGPQLLKIDGKTVANTSLYTFPTPGIHILEYYYANNTIIPYGAFSGCDRIVNIVFPYNLQKIEENALRACSRLSMDIGSLPKTITTVGAFNLYNTTSVVGILDLPNLVGININWTDAWNGAFRTGIQGIRNPGDYTVNSGLGQLGGMPNLKFVCFGENTTGFGEYLFRGDNHVEALKLAYNGVVSLVNNSLNGIPSTCLIYVPDTLVDTYKADTQWSARADYIKPISEYVEPTV